MATQEFKAKSNCDKTLKIRFTPNHSQIVTADGNISTIYKFPDLHCADTEERVQRKENGYVNIHSPNIVYSCPELDKLMQEYNSLIK